MKVHDAQRKEKEIRGILKVTIGDVGFASPDSNSGTSRVYRVQATRGCTKLVTFVKSLGYCWCNDILYIGIIFV